MEKVLGFFYKDFTYDKTETKTRKYQSFGLEIYIFKIGKHGEYRTLKILCCMSLYLLFPFYDTFPFYSFRAVRYSEVLNIKTCSQKQL